MCSRNFNVTLCLTQAIIRKTFFSKVDFGSIDTHLDRDDLKNWRTLALANKTEIMHWKGAAEMKKLGESRTFEQSIVDQNIIGRYERLRF